MKNIFIKHPNLGRESYLQHFEKVLGFSCLLFSLSFKALVHVMLPFCFETAVSDRIKTLNEGMQKRREDAMKEMGN